MWPFFSFSHIFPDMYADEFCYQYVPNIVSGAGMKSQTCVLHWLDTYLHSSIFWITTTTLFLSLSWSPLSALTTCNLSLRRHRNEIISSCTKPEHSQYSVLCLFRSGAAQLIKKTENNRHSDIIMRLWLKTTLTNILIGPAMKI